MHANFIIYGATGFIGETITRLAVEQGYRPIIAGRNPAKLSVLAAKLDLEYRVLTLDQLTVSDSAMQGAEAVLNCAGPFIHTFKPIVEGCLRQAVHYLDLTGELPVYEALSSYDSEAIKRGVMILPAVGFDVVPTDCLAVHLQQRLPSATHLNLAFQTQGPAGLPPGTARTMIELIPYGNRIRQNGVLVSPPKGIKTRMIDFGNGPIQAIRLPWGDVFTAYYSTGISNIEDYAVLPTDLEWQIKSTEYLRPLFSLPLVQKLLFRMIKPGPTARQREQTKVSVWGEVRDEQGRVAEARLHGPEAGVTWTSLSALAVIERVMNGDFLPGFQTPAKVYGADLVLACKGVTREDIR